MSITMKALRAGGLADQDRGGERSAPGLSKQLGAMGGHKGSQLAL
ncbi:MAG: hypothetical protein WAN93_09190 [Solirubrobacteraceae bacterium]